MNCTAARKLLFAFADGQLAVKDSCEVLDHLKMCAECSRVIDEHQAVRGALGRSIASVSVPVGLKFQVHSALSHQNASPKKRHSYLRPLAIAATIVLLLGAVKMYFWSDSGDNGNDVVLAPIQVQEGQSAAKAIADVHNVCCDHAATHQSRDLPHDIPQLASAINTHFSNKIAAMAPDLLSYGYRFESANFCGVQDKPGSEGGHLLYITDKGDRRLSFFSVPRWDKIDKCGNRGQPNKENWRKYQVDQPDGGKLSILAWHTNATTYICCGREPFASLEPIARDIRTALAMPDSPIYLAMNAGR